MRLITLAVGLFVTTVGPAFAQPYESPEALLEAFYAPYFSGDFPENESQFRSAALQDLYDTDAELTPEGEMGAISFDPYIDGQDYDLGELVIGEPAITGDAASVEVSFTNFGEPRSLTYELVLEDDGWKIDDVVSTSPDNPYRLSDIFAEAAAGY
ncbi:MAG TPA: DUF3828 domain-containing protein [Devosia sp.]|jgi:hypothetical protein|nr:DUF3828 domain-containing protein [Devosia sp.]